jgi:hypothetical protein
LLVLRLVAALDAVLDLQVNDKLHLLAPRLEVVRLFGVLGAFGAPPWSAWNTPTKEARLLPFKKDFLLPVDTLIARPEAFLSFTLPFMSIRPFRSSGESSVARPVSTSSSYVSIAPPTCSTIIFVSLSWFGDEQCISIEESTGHAEVTNKHSPIALATSTKFTVVHSVLPTSRVRNEIKPMRAGRCRGG